MVKCVQCSQWFQYNGSNQTQLATGPTCSACTEKSNKKLARCSQCLQHIGSCSSEPASGPTCSKCTEKSSRKFVRSKSRLRSQVEELRASVQFLSHQFETQSTAGILEGDVGIIVQGVTDQPLCAHKFILASRSEVFRKIFETNMQEKETGILRIDDATLPVIRAVISFCYNAKIEFTDEVTSEEVLEVSHKYAIHLLGKICENDLSATISEENLSKRLKLARKFMLTDLEAAASQFFKNNFDGVISDVLSEFC